MEKLGVNPTYLITQVINFTILALVLAKLVYKPVLDALEKRKKKIEEGLSITEEMTKEKEKLEVRKAKEIEEARREARAIIEKSREQGKKLEEEIVGEARREAQEIVERGKKDLEIRKKEMEAKLSRETIDIALALTQRVISDVLDKEKQEEILKKRLSEFLRGKKSLSG